MKTLGIIPARFGSTRFPGKPLALIGGITMIQRVYQRAVQASCLGEVVVATDDERIFNHVLAFGGQAEMTDPKHPSGTDRCAEVLEKRTAGGWEAVINIQGDEPFLDPEQIDQVAALLEKGPIATLARLLEDEEERNNPNVVKTVFDNHGKALYFSRFPIPFNRTATRPAYYKHIGIYGFGADILPQIARLAPGRLEQAESLEQLRWLENGFPILIGLTQTDTFGIDTPEQLEAVNKTL